MSEHTVQPLEKDEFARLMAPFSFGGAGRVAVAVSGGADSLALAVLAADWGRARGVGVVALSVDHGLRPESRAEAEQVGRWLSPIGMAHHILTWRDGAAIATAVQERARNARYGLLEAWCREHATAVLLTAHHQDDQAETFLMRLRRGSTLFGLAAMAPARSLTPSGDVTLCRPFLDVPKARLVATLRARAHDWIEDPSNVNRKYERVRVRARMGALAEMGVTAERLAGAAHAARLVTKILDRGVAVFESVAVQHRADGEILMDAAAFAALPEGLQVRTLSQLLCRVGGGAYAPRQVKMRRLLGWLCVCAGSVPGGAPKARTPARTPARTLGGCVIVRAADVVRIKKEVPRRHGGNGKIPLFFDQNPCPGRLNGLHPRQTLPLGVTSWRQMNVQP